MTLTDQLLIVADGYCAAADVDLARASLRSLGDGRLLVRLKADVATLTLTRADLALAWFSENWPEGADWPADIPRPVRGAEEPQHEVDRAA